MSFKCENCNEVSKKPIKFISKKREKTYAHTYKKGWEIVEEYSLCGNCIDKFNSTTIIAQVAPIIEKKYVISLPAKPVKQAAARKPRKPKAAATKE